MSSMSISKSFYIKSWKHGEFRVSGKIAVKKHVVKPEIFISQELITDIFEISYERQSFSFSFPAITALMKDWLYEKNKQTNKQTFC